MYLLAFIYRKLMVFVILCALSRSRSQFGSSRMSRTDGLQANTSQFTLEGKPFRILGGSIHYFRVPRAYWEDRLLKMKACGINTLTTYVPWNLHEPERGVFNFEDDLDLEAYLQLAASLGLWVILRPGPYICAEWDFGGLPSWLLRDPNMKVRTTYPGFTDAVNPYFDLLIKKVVPYQYSNGGPIIAVQVENEYESNTGTHELNVNVLMMKECVSQPHKPKMVMEYWSGWFDTWGDLHHVFPAEDMIAVVTEILKMDMSINLYMFHGGTNFGFMNGGLAEGLRFPKPMITSYDYDAPLSEAGDYTTKYRLLRNVFSHYHSEDLPKTPILSERQAHQPAVIHQHLSLWDSLQFIDKPFKSERPINMENLPVNNHNGQSYGYTLYETAINSGGSLKSNNNIRDRALVFVEKQFIGVLDYESLELMLPDGKVRKTLSFLVENFGRVNYGPSLGEQRKGIVGDIELNKKPLQDFLIYSLEMKPAFINRSTSGHWVSMRQKPSFPGFFQTKLHIKTQPKDTFVNLPGWGKGVIFVNGRNLGRYYSAGPQQTLYLPAPWLNRGENQLMVFEEKEADGKIQFSSSADYGMTVDVK
uniref:Beta-galactosidase n=1 Tax=Neogobius melanostomus TaxID=47308 RepID=A0A8C6STL0_9GOBI